MVLVLLAFPFYNISNHTVVWSGHKSVQFGNFVHQLKECTVVQFFFFFFFMNYFTDKYFYWLGRRICRNSLRSLFYTDCSYFIKKKSQKYCETYWFLLLPLFFEYMRLIWVKVKVSHIKKLHKINLPLFSTKPFLTFQILTKKLLEKYFLT